MIRRSKVSFFRRSKVSIIFDNFFQEVERMIRRLKVLKSIIIDFRSPDVLVTKKFDQELKSFNNVYKLLKSF